MLQCTEMETRLMTTDLTHPPLAMRPYTWIAFVASTSLVASYGFACAVPFAALAAVAALTLERRDALLLVGLAWASNQAVGFGLLHYPWELETFAWGLALLAVSLLAVLGAGFCASRFEGLPRTAVAFLAFLAAFAAYEGLLVLVTVALGSDSEALAPDVVAKIFAVNIGMFAGLYIVSRLPLPFWRREPVAVRSAA
jgi:hypothetical protein